MTKVNSSKVVDVLNQKFGRLLVLRRSEKRSKAGALWECKCECGSKVVTTSLKLRNGHTRSCGCYGKSVRQQVSTKHGHSIGKSRTYKTWKEMRQRCLNPNKTQYKWYGGRGISICDRWSDFTNFLKDMGERPLGKSLDRLDTNGNYEPNNCRWATPKEQAQTNRGAYRKGVEPVNKIPDEVIARAVNLQKQNVSIPKISVILKISTTTLYDRLRKYEVNLLT